MAGSVTRASPTLQRRRLGMELRRLRERAGRTLDDVATELRCSESKVSRIETGRVAPTPGDVLSMLDLYAAGPRERQTLPSAARQARRRTWYEAYGDTNVVPLVGLEAAAARIRQYAAMAVPGLLQTRAYAEAIIGALRPDLPANQLERRVQLRMDRQQVVHEDDPPALEVVLEECVVRRPVGGRDVMGEQLRRLLEVASLPNVRVQVVPLSVGAHPGMSGAFIICDLPRPDPDVVYLEEYLDHPTGDRYLEGQEQVGQYTAAFDRIRASALDPDRSAALMARAADEL
jgi:transcriptional regulator with XRE-family HTH domain